MNWEECKLRRLVKEVKPDDGLIKSLINQSNKKLITDKFSPLNQNTASTKFCNNYDSLREIMEALSIRNGFKIYNHECIFGFINQVLKMEKESFDFDNIRKIRNSINYYGEDISIESARKLINEIIILRNKMLNELKK